VGVSGPLGSGKSTLGAALAAKGADLVSGDAVGHELLDEDGSLRRRLVEAFGDDILGPRGSIDRGALGRKAFRSPDSLRKLNGIVHPLLVARLRERIAAHRRRGNGVLVVDAALIPEWGIEAEFDLMVHVTAPKADRKARWCRARGLSAAEFERRERCQIPEKEKARHADVIIRNDGDEEQLKRKAETLWDLLDTTGTGTPRPTKRVEL